MTGKKHQELPNCSSSNQDIVKLMTHAGIFIYLLYMPGYRWGNSAKYRQSMTCTPALVCLSSLWIALTLEIMHRFISAAWPVSPANYFPHVVFVLKKKIVIGFGETAEITGQVHKRKETKRSHDDDNHNNNNLSWRMKHTNSYGILRYKRITKSLPEDQTLLWTLLSQRISG